MKKVFLALLLFSGICSAQPSSTRVSGTLTAACTNATTACDSVANSQVKFGVGEYTLATVTATGTFTGSTLNFEFSDDGGTTWYSTNCTRNDSSIQELSEALPNSTNRSWDCGLTSGNSSLYRIRQSAISTGGPTVSANVGSAQIEPAPTVSLALPNTGFYVISNPAAGSQASASQAAAGANVKNVATEICFSAGAVVAPVLTALTVNLRDGATGAGTVKATFEVIIPATTGQSVVPFCTMVSVIGTANTAMTLEFSAALANLIESATLHGYTTP